MIKNMAVIFSREGTIISLESRIHIVFDIRDETAIIKAEKRIIV